jgi:Lecithin retinol acyltransferase
MNHTLIYPQGGLRDARKSKRCQHGVWGLRRNDRLLVGPEEPPLGSHLVTPRRGFSHHGIYVGDGTVIHYHSAVRGFSRGPVEEVSLASFALGRAIGVRIHTTPRFDGAEVARRARSRVGEYRYRLLSNNCEHYCEWCLQGEQRSYQVERWLSLPRRVARVLRDAAIALLPAGSSAFGLRAMRRSNVAQEYSNAR